MSAPVLGFRTPANDDLATRSGAGVRKAPRHEIAGGTLGGRAAGSAMGV
jgi:hypothetical protein